MVTLYMKVPFINTLYRVNNGLIRVLISSYSIVIESIRSVGCLITSVTLFTDVLITASTWNLIWMKSMKSKASVID